MRNSALSAPNAYPPYSSNTYNCWTELCPPATGREAAPPGLSLLRLCNGEKRSDES